MSLGPHFTRPRSINPQGDVVGFYGTGSVSHGFLLLEGSFTKVRLKTIRS